MSGKKSEKLVLVDGSGYIFRAFHGLPMMTRPDGTPINAVFGFTKMLLKLTEDLKPSHVVVIFDAGRVTFRNDIYPEYKANRSEPPEELVPQFPLVREAAKAMSLPVLEMPGFEADDLIASFARAAENQNMSCLIVSSDKDLMQLVRGSVSMLDPMKNKTIGAAEVIEKFGVGPDKVIDVQSLAGDSTDNVFSAYPKVRKNKLEEAFNDRDNQGFVWNNLMLQRWTDHNGVEHRVKECYERNKKLIDLTQQPEEIRTKVFAEILQAQNPKHVDQVGIRFMKFCAKYGLTKLSEQPTDHAQYLNAGYPGVESQTNN